MLAEDRVEGVERHPQIGEVLVNLITAASYRRPVEHGAQLPVPHLDGELIARAAAQEHLFVAAAGNGSQDLDTTLSNIAASWPN